MQVKLTSITPLVKASIRAAGGPSHLKSITVIFSAYEPFTDLEPQLVGFRCSLLWTRSKAPDFLAFQAGLINCSRI